MQISQLSMVKPDDWHIHLREGEALPRTVYDAARQFSRVMVMPNLRNPITSVDKALVYKKQITAVLANLMALYPQEARTLQDFTPLMTLYLTQDMPLSELDQAKNSDFIHGIKLYPMGATTLSDQGVSNIPKLAPIFDRMQTLGLVLQIHGEVTHGDIFDKEKVFIDTELAYLVNTFPKLKIVLEHITTQEAVEFILSAPNHIAATITPHHLLINRNDMFYKGIRPHYYCLPVAKRQHHQEKLLWAATSGNSKFFLGTDSAPHAQNKKESACGCAGIYSAHDAMAYYAMAFDQAGKIENLDYFATRFGAEFYGLPVHNIAHISSSASVMTLRKQNCLVPDFLVLNQQEQDKVIPFMAGETLSWNWCTA